MLPLAVTLALKQVSLPHSSMYNSRLPKILTLVVSSVAIQHLGHSLVDKLSLRQGELPFRLIQSFEVSLLIISTRQTAILHRWAGRVIWAFSTAHAVAWFYQLSLDKDPFGRPCLIPVWSWYRFTAGAVVSFI